MEFHPIKLADRQEYEKQYRAVRRMTSDASFATPYVWAPSFHTELCSEADILCVQGKNREGVPYYMMPVGHGDKAAFLKRLYERCHDLGIPFSLHWLHREDVTLMEAIFPGKLEVQESRNSAEYVYETESLCTLSGKKLHGKRNHVNAFRAAYTSEVCDITAENICNARQFVLQHCNSPEETLAMERLFDAYFDLGLTGMLLYAGDALVGVTAGEMLTDDTALIHLEKADTAFTGAYAAINQCFVENYFAHTKYINREEDMGIPGLRKAKLSYHPVQLLAKYSALALGEREHQIMELWQRVFGDKRSDIEEFMVQLYSPERAFTLSEEGQIVSMLHIVPLSDSIRKIAYIYAVATAEEYRGRGLATQLITRALEVIDSSDFDCAVLIPSSSSTAHFYEKFGFRYTGYTLDFSTFGIDFDLGTGDSSKDFAMERRVCLFQTK